MTIQHEVKVDLLTKFHSHLYEPQWNFTESQEKDRVVLEEFPKASS